MIRFSPMSSMMKLQRLCSLSSPTDYPESFVKQFASRHFSPPELPLKVRTLFQVHKRVRWDGNWGNEVLNLTTSIKWAHGPGAGSESRSNPIFVLHCLRTLFSPSIIFRWKNIYPPSIEPADAPFLLHSVVPENDGVPAGSGTETPSLRFFDSTGRVYGAVSDSEKDT